MFKKKKGKCKNRGKWMPVLPLLTCMGDGVIQFDSSLQSAKLLST